jgi:hypothetical protein
MPKVTVLTVSRRIGWEKMAAWELKKQTFQDFDWVIVTENDLDIHPYCPTQVRAAPPKTRQSNLNASLNEGLRHCKGDYVILYQDFIELQADCFEKLLKLATPNTFVTTLTLNPPGTEPDPRAVPGTPPHDCWPERWEANVAIAPMGILRYLGGFDEEYDNGWSWDNCNIAVRAAALGCQFIIDPTNNPQLLPHDRSDIKELNGEFHAQRIRDIAEGKFPLRLNYLQDERRTNS